MKIVGYFAVLFFTLSVACAGGGSSSYSTQKSVEPASGNADQSRSGVTTAANAAAPVSPEEQKTRGGGGGGGAQPNAAKPAAADISLAKTETSQVDTTPTDRKIVRNAELNLEADSPEDAQRKITTIAESNGGFVVESQQSSSDVTVTTRDVVTMTVRVPAGKFGEALDEIRKTASRVIVETVKGEDVTEEFIDIEARLKAKRALEQQFMEIMKRANTVEDALNVQSELADVRGEIERIEGRKHFLENQASLSTIKVRIQTPAAFSASSSGFFYRLGQSISSGFDFALNFILALVTLIIAILPFALIVGIPTYLLVRRFKRNRARHKTAAEIAKEEI